MGVVVVKTIRPKCFNRSCSNSPRADKRAGWDDLLIALLRETAAGGGAPFA